MDRFPSMHDEDMEKLGIRPQGPHAREDSWSKGRKRARELSDLRGKLDRASEKEQQSWDLLKQAVKGGGSAMDEGRFTATGISKATEELRERTVGLVTAEEFRKARQAADASEKAAEMKRREEQLAAQEVEEALRRKAEKKKRKAAEKKRRLLKSTVSFTEDDGEDHDHGDDHDQQREEKGLEPRKITAFAEEGAPAQATLESHSAGERFTRKQATSDLDAEDRTAFATAGSSTAQGSYTAGSGASSGMASTASKPGKGEGGGGGGKRDMTGAAPDGDNSDAASMLKARLGR
ncbi:unnamed protein product [Ascophyllum nodosum]